MEINVGDYVRTNLGIGTVHRIYNDNGGYYVRFSKKVIKKWVTITNHSKDIIDLIEVGDYVNGLEVYETGIFGHNGKKFCRIYGNVAPFYNEYIKSILTKEQFEQNCYKVEKVDDK